LIGSEFLKLQLWEDLIQRMAFLGNNLYFDKSDIKDVGIMNSVGTKKLNER
jgi:hypothetical protein